MKPTIPLVACIIVALVALGCKRSERPDPGKYNKVASSQGVGVASDEGNSVGGTQTNQEQESGTRRRKPKKKKKNKKSNGNDDNSGTTTGFMASPEAAGDAEENIELSELKFSDNKDKGKGRGNGNGNDNSEQNYKQPFSEDSSERQANGEQTEPVANPFTDDAATESESVNPYTDEKNCGLQNYQETALPQSPMTQTSQDGQAGHPWTWHIRLVYTDPGTREPIMKCAAFFIKAKDDEEKSDMISAPASCITKMNEITYFVEYLNRENFWVILGSHKMNPSAPDEIVEQGEKTLRIADWLVKDEYKGGIRNNVAVIRLNDTVDVSAYIGPICRPTKGTPELEPTEDDQCIIVGWPIANDGNVATGGQAKTGKKKKKQKPSSGNESGDDQDDEYCKQRPTDFADINQESRNRGPDYFIDPDEATFQKMAWAIWKADEPQRAKMNIDFDISWGPKVPKDAPLNDPDVWPPEFFTSVELDKLLRFPINNATWELLEAHEGDDIELQNDRAKDLFEVFTNSEPYKTLRKSLDDAELRLAKNPEKFKQVVHALLFGRYTMLLTGEKAFYIHHCIGENNIHLETLEKTAMGIHHWLCLFFKQVKGRLQFVGHVKDQLNFFPTLRYRIGDYWKAQGSIFLGPTIAYEMAIFLLAYFARYNREAKFFLPACTPVTITAWDYELNGKKFLASGFPCMFIPEPDKDICPVYARFKHPDQKTLYRMGWELWKADQDARAKIGTDFEVDLSPKIDWMHKHGKPRESYKLFKFVKTDNLSRRSSTYFKLWELLKAYDSRDPNSITQQEQHFFNEVKKTGPYRKLKELLTEARYPISQWNDVDYDRYMTTLWIKSYQKTGAPKPYSYCENYFFGVESTVQKTSTKTMRGLNYWLSIYFRESRKEKTFKYIGHIHENYKLLPNIRFTVDGYLKEDGAVFMGPSPEFEIAFITLGLFTRYAERAKFWLGVRECASVYVQANHYTAGGDKCLMRGGIGFYIPGNSEECPGEIKKEILNQHADPKFTSNK